MVVGQIVDCVLVEGDKVGGGVSDSVHGSTFLVWQSPT